MTEATKKLFKEYEQALVRWMWRSRCPYLPSISSRRDRGAVLRKAGMNLPKWLSRQLNITGVLAKHPQRSYPLLKRPSAKNIQ